METRKTVTLVFADLVGSTALGDRLDPESFREVLGRYFDAMRTVLERHSGVVEKYIGDAIMAVFGLPTAHEDDALRAVRAAAEMRGQLAELNRELERVWGVTLQNRIGVNSGEVVAGDPAHGQRLVTGDAVNVAARLEQASSPGSVLIGESTYRMVRGHVEVEEVGGLQVKGKPLPVPAHRLIRMAAEPREGRRLDAPMVGRRRELSALTEEFDIAVGQGSCRLVTIIGPAGVGKSRLANEFLSSIRERATVLRGRCLSYGEGITFWPVAEVIRQVLTSHPEAGSGQRRWASLIDSSEDSAAIADRLDALIEASDASYPVEDTMWAFRKLLESLARNRLVVVVFDDIHWGEPVFLDLVEHVLGTARDRILLFCLARPEFQDQRPRWSGGLENASTLALQPLGPAESKLLVSNLVHGLPLASEALERILTVSEGNPLFVEEILGMFIDDGLVTRSDGQWVLSGDISSISIPPTISALLAARLDRLDPLQRSLLERASVIGQVFYRGAVREMSPFAAREEVDAGLARLARAEFIRAEPETLADEDAFRFRHILIRDAAYNGILKRARADLHERFANWLATVASEHLSEYEEIVGYHLEQAHRYIAELGPLDDRGRSLGGRAALHLAAAGRRALQRDDAPATVNLLSRAVTLWSGARSELVLLLTQLAETLEEGGDYPGADEAIKKAEEAAEETGDPLLRGRAELARLSLRLSSETGAFGQTVGTGTDHLLSLFQECEDNFGLAKLWNLRSYVGWAALRFGEAEEDLRRALAHAELAGDVREEGNALARLAQCLPVGPTPVPEALSLCRQIIGRLERSRYAKARAEEGLSYLLAMAGEFDEARSEYRRGIAAFEDLGMAVAAAAYAQIAGHVEMLAGNLEAAAQILWPSVEFLASIGNRFSLPTNAGILAQVLCEQERFDHAEGFIRISRESASPGDVDANCRWRIAEALVLASRGDLVASERLAREALALSEQTGDAPFQAEIRIDIATILEKAGRAGQAADVLRVALRLSEAKGNVVSAEKVRERLWKLNHA